MIVIDLNCIIRPYPRVRAAFACSQRKGTKRCTVALIIFGNGEQQDEAHRKPTFKR
jgi:hypothetical protein